MPRIRALHLPVGTRVIAVTHHPNGSAFGDTWRVWIGVKNLQSRVENWQGTYLELHGDGSIIQYNNERDEGYEIMESKYNS